MYCQRGAGKTQSVWTGYGVDAIWDQFLAGQEPLSIPQSQTRLWSPPRPFNNEC
jgi:hypothetical protein